MTREWDMDDDPAHLSPRYSAFDIDPDLRWRAVGLAQRALDGGALSREEVRLLAACHLFQYQRMAAIHQIAEGRLAHREPDPANTVTVEAEESGDGGEA